MGIQFFSENLSNPLFVVVKGMLSALFSVLKTYYYKVWP